MTLDGPYIRDIIAVCDQRGASPNQTAYILATAWHETGGMRWLKEIWGPTAAQKRYDGKVALGNVHAGDGRKFSGRGFVQITGRRNYSDWSKRLGVDLLSDPGKAEQPTIASLILVDGMLLGTFTGIKLSDYVNSNKTDFTGARRVVNGTDKAALIAGYANDFAGMLKEDGFGTKQPQASVHWLIVVLNIISKLWRK